MTACTCSIHSPFRFRELPRDSVFATDTLFLAYKGKTRNQISSESVDRITAATGKNPGSVMWISSHSSRLIEEGNARRRAQRG